MILCQSMHWPALPWPTASTGFDDVDLYRDGEQLETFKSGYALATMHRRFPGVAMRGVVLV
jgi:hypothetical protein